MIDLFQREKACTRCGLRRGCSQVVTPSGPTPCPIMIVGEAPGADEDERGSPFVGASGKLLNRMIVSADLQRENVFITNVVRCRPPDNRTPETVEINACKPWLWEEIKLVDPLVILAMGATASKLLMHGNSTFRITKVVGQPKKVDFLREGGIVVPMFHPSYLLQHSMKELEDMVKVIIRARNYVAQHDRPHPVLAGSASDVDPGDGEEAG